MADEEFHEIQLNGKQLVFLFMTGTVAAVVIFLCGLMVGRNIRTPRLETAAVAEAAASDPTRADQAPPPAATADTPTPVTTGETLTYANHLEAPTPAEESLRDEDFPPAAASSDRAAPPPAVTEAPVEKKAPAAALASADPSTAEPPGTGWAVQVQAVKTRAEADALARRLSAKGYRSFVTTATAGLYRVRVGKYENKRDADLVRARLEKEEQFTPWVTR